MTLSTLAPIRFARASEPIPDPAVPAWAERLHAAAALAFFAAVAAGTEVLGERESDAEREARNEAALDAHAEWLRDSATWSEDEWAAYEAEQEGAA